MLQFKSLRIIKQDEGYIIVPVLLVLSLLSLMTLQILSVIFHEKKRLIFHQHSFAVEQHALMNLKRLSEQITSCITKQSFSYTDLHNLSWWHEHVVCRDKDDAYFAIILANEPCWQIKGNANRGAEVYWLTLLHKENDEQILLRATVILPSNISKTIHSRIDLRQIKNLKNKERRQFDCKKDSIEVMSGVQFYILK